MTYIYAKIIICFPTICNACGYDGFVWNMMTNYLSYFLLAFKKNHLINHFEQNYTISMFLFWVNFVMLLDWWSLTTRFKAKLFYKKDTRIETYVLKIYYMVICFSGYGRNLANFIYLFSNFDEYLSDFFEKMVVELYKSHHTPFFIGRLLTFLLVLVVICNEYISFPFVLHHYFSIQVFLVIKILV